MYWTIIKSLIHCRLCYYYYMHYFRLRMLLWVLLYLYMAVDNLYMTVIVGSPFKKSRLFSLLMAKLSRSWHPCLLYSLMCANNPTGGCQVWKCFWVSELGQRSNECKINILLFNTSSLPKLPAVDPNYCIKLPLSSPRILKKRIKHICPLLAHYILRSNVI